jgi:hypothetical protein
MSSPITGDLKTLASTLIRRPLFGGVFLAPYSAPLPTTLTATAGQVSIPADYESVGRISEDGLTFASDRSMQEVRGWGSTSVLRRDVESIDVTLQFAMLETKRISYEVMSGLDLSDVEMSVAGEFKFTMPSQPPVRYFRVIALGADGTGDGRYYLAKVFGRMSITDQDDETWQASDDAPLVRNVTLGADEDDVAGGPYTEFLFGPGALAAAEAMGITVAGT